MTISISKQTFTADEFIAMPGSEDYELVDGQLVERELMGAISGYIAAQIIFLIKSFCKASPCGWVLDSEVTYRCFGSSATLRRCDVSLIRYGRLRNETPPDGYVSIAPDLAVEVVSPGDLAYEIEAKVHLYLESGFPLIWVVYPNKRTVHVHRADGSAQVLNGQQRISGESALPGFNCPVSEFFEGLPAPASDPS